MRADNERGAALVTVLTMLAIMAALAVVVIGAADMSLRRTANQLRMEQTHWYLMGAESFATSKIAEMRAREADVRIDQAEWQDRAITFPLDDGVMQVSLRDGSNCFNLNSVAPNPDAEEGGYGVGGMLQFALLLDLLEIRSDRVALAAALADWIDADSVPAPGGAEDGPGANGPYRPANAPMGDISELRRVRGFDDEMVARLAPFVCVRPTSRANALNPNTLLPDQAPLLSMAIPDISVEEARNLIRNRPRGGWADINAFFNQAPLAGLELGELRRSSFSMQSDYYVMSARIERDGASEAGAALIRMQGQTGAVVRRVFGAGAAGRVL